MKNKRKIDICLTPSLLDLFNLAEKNVIIIESLENFAKVELLISNSLSFVVMTRIPSIGMASIGDKDCRTW